jgi:RNAse (barnase) inhibitor barstar
MEPMAKQLADARQCGVYQLSLDPEKIEGAAGEAGLAVFRIDAGDARDKKDFLDHLAKTLNFPDWFGRNWDALNDCLTDLEWLSARKGYVLIFENTERFGSNHRQELRDAIAVFRAASEYWKTENRPFWTFIAVSSKEDSGLPRWPKR